MKYSRIALAAAVAATLFSKPANAETLLLSDTFTYPNGLITNEFAYWNPSVDISRQSSKWELTSGSLFAVNGAGWTGVPDDVSPNALSSNGTNSSVFRLNTKRRDFGDVAVTMSFLNQGLNSSNATPPVDWDGLHIWLRYQSEVNLYYASINRRDNTCIIKKKIPGGPSNGGTYYDLCEPVPHKVPYGAWQKVKATVQNNPDGSVSIKLYDANGLVASAIDDGSIGGPPIRNPGAVGMRGDNANLKFDNFAVSSLSSSNDVLPGSPSNVKAIPGDQTVTIKWSPVPGALSYNLYRSRFPGVTKSNGYLIKNVTSPRVNTGFTNGTRYYMVVTAVNASGESKESLQVSAVPTDVVVPQAPTGVVTKPGDSNILIGWNPVPGAISYNLYRSRYPGVNKSNGYKIQNVSNPYLNEGFVNGTHYYMVVTAVNASGESPDSAEVVDVPRSSTLMAAGGAAVPEDLNAARVFPNPWKGDRDRNLPVTFDRLTRNSTVKIFNPAGELVATLPTSDISTTWDLKNTSGDTVASGLYVYMITNGSGQKNRGVMAVVR